MPHMQLYLAGAVAVLVLGSMAAFIFLRQETPNDASSWGSAGGLFLWNEPAPVETPDNIDYRGDGVEDLGIVPLPVTPLGDTGGNALVSDLANLLGELTQPASAKEEEDFVPSAYSFIPQGLISISGSPQQRSPDDLALFEYGNSIGSSLRAFADMHTDMPQILKDQAEDRTDPLKVAALKRLADDFTALGDELSTLSSVPSSAENTHKALVAAYHNVGAKLKLVPDASGDDAFLAAVNSYNPAAEDLSRRLVELADLFASRNIVFSSSDAGSIFIFTGGSAF